MERVYTIFLFLIVPSSIAFKIFSDFLRTRKESDSSPYRSSKGFYESVKLMKRTLLSFIFLASIYIPVFAHDFWLQTSTFYPKLEELVLIHTMVGHRFEGEALPRNPYHIKQFLLANINGVAPVMGMDGKKPAGIIRVRIPGLYILGYHSNRTFNEMEASKFEDYLREEGLEHVIELRAKKNESQKKGLEYFSRYAKTMVAVNGDCSGPYDHVFGFPLELVPQQNPFTFQTGKDFSILLLYKGKPLEGAIIKASQYEDKDKIILQKTDANGLIQLPIAKGGAWIISVIHIVELPKGMDADWESFWGSLYVEFPKTKKEPEKKEPEKK